MVAVAKIKSEFVQLGSTTVARKFKLAFCRDKKSLSFLELQKFIPLLNLQLDFEGIKIGKLVLPIELIVHFGSTVSILSPLQIFKNVHAISVKIESENDGDKLDLHADFFKFEETVSLEQHEMHERVHYALFLELQNADSESSKALHSWMDKSLKGDRAKKQNVHDESRKSEHILSSMNLQHHDWEKETCPMMQIEHLNAKSEHFQAICSNEEEYSRSIIHQIGKILESLRVTTHSTYEETSPVL